MKRKKIGKFEVILSAIVAWFILVNREPYIPLVLFLFIPVLVAAKEKYSRIISIVLFFILCIGIFATMPFKESFYELVTFNQTIAHQQIQETSTNPIISLLFPIYLLFNGQYSLMRIIEILLAITLGGAGFIYFQKTKNWKHLIFIIVALGLAAIRTNVPGQELYGTYRMLTWITVLLMTIVFFLFKNENSFKLKQNYPYIAIFFLAFAIIIFSPQSYVFKKLDRLNEFNIGYSSILIPGRAIELTSSSNDSLFVYGYQSIIFWQARIPSAYKYTYFYPPQYYVSKYINEVKHMFTTSPPTYVYISDCSSYGMSEYRKYVKNYMRVLLVNKDTCLLMKNTKIASLSASILSDFKATGYSFAK